MTVLEHGIRSYIEDLVEDHKYIEKKWGVDEDIVRERRLMSYIEDQEYLLGYGIDEGVVRELEKMYYKKLRPELVEKHQEKVNILENEFREHKLSCAAAYPESFLWRLAFLAMDVSPIVWIALHIWVGKLVLPPLMGYWDCLTMKRMTLFVLGINIIRDWLLTMPILVWFSIRNGLCIYVNDTAPSEAEVLLLEWRRNQMEFEDGLTAFIYLFNPMLDKIIEKARNNGYGSLVHYDKDKIREEARITKELCALLDQDENLLWIYDHNQWIFKDLWPKGTYTARFIAILLVDAHFTTGWPIGLGGFFMLLLLCDFPGAMPFEGTPRENLFFVSYFFFFWFTWIVWHVIIDRFSLIPTVKSIRDPSNNKPSDSANNKPPGSDTDIETGRDTEVETESDTEDEMGSDTEM